MKEYISRNKLIKEYLKIKNIKIIISKNKNIKLPDDELSKYCVLEKNNYSNIKKLITKDIEGYSFDNILFTNMRESLNNKVYISKKLEIYFYYLTRKEQLVLMMHHYYLIKDTISVLGIDTFLEYYRQFNWNDSIDNIPKNAFEHIEEYFYSGSLKDLVKKYKKEVDSSIDEINPNLSDNMIIKYLNNYYSKLIILRYDDNLIKEFLKNYYITDYQAEDNVNDFINNMIFTYQIFINKKFECTNQYRYKLGYYDRFQSSNISLEKRTKIYNKIDKILSSKENYYKLLFMYELLELREYKSRKKKIVNYVTALELMLTHSPKNSVDTISSQFITKTLKCLEKCKKKDYSKNEIKLIYTYRSKIIHGDYDAITKIIKSLSKIPSYQIKQTKLKKELYLYKDQLIEEILEKRTNDIFKKIFILFIKDYGYINGLKLEVIK